MAGEVTDGEDLTCFGPYRIVRRIGSGGMGTIFEADDTGLGQRVALKLLHAHVARRPGAPERFLREGRAAARVRHPHVIQVFALGTARDTPYLAMELLHGGDLSELIARRGFLPVDEALDLFLPVVAAIGAAHDAGVIHRDLKPSNVYLARGPRAEPWPKVLDFGVSKVIAGASEASTTDSVVGTAAYMAPEQARAAGNASFRSNQYSLAVLLYRCITGSLPFEGQGLFEVIESVMTAPVVPPSARGSGIPRPLDGLVLRAMSRSPEDRFPSVRAFGAALMAFASQRTSLVLTPELLPAAALQTSEAVSQGESSTLPAPAPTLAGDTSASRHVSERVPVVGRLRSAESGADELALGLGPVPRGAAQWPSADLIEGHVATFDGVAATVRGDTMAMLWKASARVARTRWVFDIIDSLIARQSGGINVLMIILPTAAPPDREARLENERRIRRTRSSFRVLSTVVLGTGVFPALLRTAVRMMMVPHLGSASGSCSVAETVEAGVARIRADAWLATPSFNELHADVRAMFRALGLDPP